MTVPKTMRSFLWSLLAIAVFLGLASFLKATIPANPMKSVGGASFARGVLHGALMPLALVPILAVEDIPIYDVSNTGRGYHLGYILGVNLCGFIFIPPMARSLTLGMGFLKRKRATDER